MAVDWFNEKGGITIKGEKYLFEAVTEDHKCTAEGSKTATEKLVNDHKVKFIERNDHLHQSGGGAVTEPAKSSAP
jgi:ABC-type branched-subunit amino acid transport system substrate-binding protein